MALSVARGVFQSRNLDYSCCPNQFGSDPGAQRVTEWLTEGRSITNPAAIARKYCRPNTIIEKMGNETPRQRGPAGYRRQHSGSCTAVATVVKDKAAVFGIRGDAPKARSL